MVTRFREMKNTVAPVMENAKKEMAFVKAREVLNDGAMNKNNRNELALSMLVQEIEKRGGKLESVGPEGSRNVTCTLSIPAGKANLSRLVRFVENGQVKTMQVTWTNSMDEKIVDAAIGFGMGALDVCFKVKGQECFYIIRTNGSRHCLEENKVNVALALVGAASIVEEMLEANRGKGTKDVPKLIELKIAA